MSEKINFEKIYEEIQESVKELEKGEKNLSESIEIYKKVSQKITEAKKMLEKMENQIEEIIEN